MIKRETKIYQQKKRSELLMSTRMQSVNHDKLLMTFDAISSYPQAVFSMIDVEAEVDKKSFYRKDMSVKININIKEKLWNNNREDKSADWGKN